MSAFSRRMTAWSVGAFDFENDGWKDLSHRVVPFSITNSKFCDVLRQNSIRPKIASATNRYGNK